MINLVQDLRQLSGQNGNLTVKTEIFKNLSIFISTYGLGWFLLICMREKCHLGGLQLTIDLLLFFHSLKIRDIIKNLILSNE